MALKDALVLDERQTPERAGEDNALRLGRQVADQLAIRYRVEVIGPALEAESGERAPHGAIAARGPALDAGVPEMDLK
ncbi:MAG TPA: hypothetical protein VM683_04685 [Anaeromyxobacteraceae bacterium]|jgi:hypothetical protein|nr:hypothetical protein [Anaeromyxobacteraceae bacterium]